MKIIYGPAPGTEEEATEEIAVGKLARGDLFMADGKIGVRGGGLSAFGGVNVLYFGEADCVRHAAHQQVTPLLNAVLYTGRRKQKGLE